MILQFEKRELILKETFSIAYGNYQKRNSLLVQLKEDGCCGYGECVEINYYGIHLDVFIHELRRIQPFLEHLKIVHPTVFYELLKSQKLHSFLISALDCAYWDLYGKLEKTSFIELNSLPSQQLVDSSYTISIASVEDQIQKMEKSTWSKFKVKLNGYQEEQVYQLIQSGFSISLDANASFLPEDCVALQESSFSSQLLYIEQPLEIGNYNGLNAQGYANWMADEDAQNESVLEVLTPHYQCINVKLMKCGGLTPALKMIHHAKKLGFRVMLGCMTESTVGISADCALAGLLDYADLDGANLIANDFATGSYVEKGKIHLSDQPGLGIALK